MVRLTIKTCPGMNEGETHAYIRLGNLYGHVKTWGTAEERRREIWQTVEMMHRIITRNPKAKHKQPIWAKLIFGVKANG